MTTNTGAKRAILLVIVTITLLLLLPPVLQADWLKDLMAKPQPRPTRHRQ
jgi:hypothetical protein